jgi:NADH dehydrogenase FAD-containing subunit
MKSRTRRRFLTTAAALGAAAVLPGIAAPLTGASLQRLLPPAKGRRVIIVGGGWGGLSAARHLRDLAPGLEVVLLERNPSFWSCPLSNKWLGNLLDEKLLTHDYAPAAQTYGYTFIQTAVSDIDRERHRVITAQGVLDYDWLILAVGIRYDYAAWFGGDRHAIEHTRQHHPCAYQPGREFHALKSKLDHFAGGDLLMNLPLLPYRCPPSPYERALVIAAQFKARKIKGRLIILDPNPLMPAFRRPFNEHYREQIVYVPRTGVKSVDPFNKMVSTEFDDYRFDDAILMPPQQAADLVWQAGLIARDSSGKPTGWAEPDPLHLHARDDERIFLIGDLIDQVSPLFGRYPKGGHLAARLGRIAAHEIAARAGGNIPPALLPDSVCHVLTSMEPQEMMRIDSQFKLRADGVIAQSVKQTFDPNPMDEDIQWAKGMFAEFLGYKG